ncbi:unnamed protein product [marine sediment metagenome]|uniref:Uncharacterized protein n=1 Tax=marine sediment metagenome TaxID=412755 RepID=X0YXS0_9ZZZZ
MIAFPMTMMDFLYTFLEVEEYNKLKAVWNKKGIDPIIIIYPEKIHIWLLPY